jgi:hypothetical protein
MPRTCTGEVWVRSKWPLASQNARRMLRRDVERVEIVILGFDLGTIQHGESQRSEQIFDLVLNLCDGVQASRARARRWQRKIHPFAAQPFVLGCEANLCATLVVRFF